MKKINFLFTYTSFYILPIILLLSQTNISLITSTHLKYYFGSQLIILLLFTFISYFIYRFCFPIINIKVNLGSFLIINSFFIFLLFYYRPILFYFFPGEYDPLVHKHTQTWLNHLTVLIGYSIFYLILFNLYEKGKKLINTFFIIYILINFLIFLAYSVKYNSSNVTSAFNFIEKLKFTKNTNIDDPGYNKSQWLKIDKIKKSSTKTDIFFIVFDGMLSLDRAEKLNIVNQDDHIKELNLNGFTYVDNFSSNYIPTYLSLASTLGSSFPVTEKSEKYKNHSNFFPKFLLNPRKENNFINIINKLKYKFVWAGNLHVDCIPNIYTYCFTKNITKDYLTKLRILYFDSIFVYFLNSFTNKTLFNEIDAEKFLSNISIYNNLKDSLKEKSIFLIHVLKPHPPFEFDKNCNKLTSNIDHDPDVEDNNYLEKYKIAYNCSLKIINNWISQQPKNKDESITFIFADHGWFFDKSTKKKVKDQYNLNELDFRLPVYFAYKIPDRCKNLQVPKSSINLMRFALNCAEGLDLEFLENKRYFNFPPGHKNYGYVREYKKEKFDPNCYSTVLQKKTAINSNC